MKIWFNHGAWCSRRARKLIDRLRPEDIKSVAVIRHAAVGDMIVVRPFLIELRRFFPNARITLSICSNYARAVPADLVDNLHTVYGSDRKDVSLWQQIKQARQLGAHDMLFDLAATPRSFVTCLLNNAKLKIGFPYHSVQKYLYYDLTVPRSDFRLEADNLLDMLNVFGHRERFPLDYGMKAAHSEHIRPYVLYYPSASTSEKCWPQEYFRDLVSRMAKTFHEYDHIILEGIEDWEKIDSIIDPLKEQSNISGIALMKCDGSLSEIKGVPLINGAAMLVSNDTSIRHIAIACNTPTVGIFFKTEVFRYWPRCGNHDVVFNPDGEIPDIGNVYNASKNMLQRTTVK